MPIPQDLLPEFDLFSEFSPSELESLTSDVRIVTVSRATTLFNAGDNADLLYLVIDGKIKLSQPTATRKENLLEIMGPGDVFGELSLFDPGPRTSSAVTLTESTLGTLSHAIVRSWIDERPDVAFRMLGTLARRLRRANENVADLIFADVPSRVAKALIDLSGRFGTPSPSVGEHAIRVNHDMTQEELAAFVGASRETVNKSLAEFAMRGWIRLEGRSVIIVDPSRLGRRSHYSAATASG